MRKARLMMALALAIASIAATARAADVAPALAGLGFLVGSWTAGVGQVAETGGSSTGRSKFTTEAGGALLLRRDHTELFDKSGQPAGSFDQIMTIYAENGAIHADYFDGTHVIHYMSATVVPGQSVTFMTAAISNAPAFRLSYTLDGSVLSVAFGIALPGAAGFHPIATGTLHRAN